MRNLTNKKIQKLKAQIDNCRQGLGSDDILGEIKSIKNKIAKLKRDKKRFDLETQSICENF
tara:strand:+ start:247 stop:429 length:183 start_codon:yes stop_codon:yes gene_type:complete